MDIDIEWRQYFDWKSIFKHSYISVSFFLFFYVLTLNWFANQMVEILYYIFILVWGFALSVGAEFSVDVVEEMING